MKAATHFNPVDLVCGVRDSKGRKFDLRRYTDPATGFISSKSSGGRELRAQELPGLWNGTMSRWNTIFVDVPITTFSPVKVVQDLLRPQHRARRAPGGGGGAGGGASFFCGAAAFPRGRPFFYGAGGLLRDSLRRAAVFPAVRHFISLRNFFFLFLNFVKKGQIIAVCLSFLIIFYIFVCIF